MSDGYKNSNLSGDDDLPQDELFILDENSTPQKVAERLGQVVKRAGGPAAVMAKSGIKRTTLRRLLNGYEAKQRALVALADACGVSVEWLATGRGMLEGNSVPGSRPQFSEPMPAHFQNSDVVAKWPRLRPVDADMISSAVSLAHTSVYRGNEPVDASDFLASLDEFYGAFTDPNLDDPARYARIAAISQKYRDRTGYTPPSDNDPPRSNPDAL